MSVDMQPTYGDCAELVHRTVAIEKKQLEIEEKGVRVKLTIVDTPGFNDAVNAEERFVTLTHSDKGETKMLDLSDYFSCIVLIKNKRSGMALL